MWKISSQEYPRKGKLEGNGWGSRDFLQSLVLAQWFSTSLTWQSINSSCFSDTPPRPVKLFSPLLHNCNFANINVCVFPMVLGNPDEKII